MIRSNMVMTRSVVSVGWSDAAARFSQMLNTEWGLCRRRRRSTIITVDDNVCERMCFVCCCVHANVHVCMLRASVSVRKTRDWEKLSELAQKGIVYVCIGRFV